MGKYREGNGTPLQYSCLENPMDGRAWQAAVLGVAKSRTRLIGLHFHFSLLCIGEGNGNPLQCSCLENPRDRGAWWAAIYGVTQSQTRLKQLSSSNSSSNCLHSLIIRDLLKVIDKQVLQPIFIFLSQKILLQSILCHNDMLIKSFVTSVPVSIQ